MLQNQRKNFSLNYNPINEYIEDIYIKLKDEERAYILKEKSNHINGNTAQNDYGYMSMQTEINEIMRAILIDWLVSTHLKFMFRTRTLFLTVSIIDRYLSKEVINRRKLQLLGVTSLFIASKHEEINTPSGNSFANFTDDAYTKEEIFQMEYQILQTLNFEILIPTPIQFYEIICFILNFKTKEISLGRYFMESCMIQYKFTSYSSSLIAISTAYLVLKYFSLKNHHIIFSEFFNSNNNYNKVKECAREIYNFDEENIKSNLFAVKNKYGRTHEQDVSALNIQNRNN